MLKKLIILSLLGIESFVFPAYAGILTTAEVEQLIGIARIPSGAFANRSDLKENRTKVENCVIIINDILRLSGSVLSMLNNQKDLDFDSYEYFWATYDSACLVSHVKDLFKNKEKIDEQDVVLDEEAAKKSWVALHKVLPIIEGYSAFMAATSRMDGFSGEKVFCAYARAFCKWLNTFSRLLDNIVVSKKLSKTQFAYVMLLVVSSVEFVRQTIFYSGQFDDFNRREREKWDREWRENDEFFRNFFGGGFRQNGNYRPFGAEQNEEALLNAAYQELGLARGADFEAVKRAHRALARQYHPDKNLGNEEAVGERFKRIQGAYDRICDHLGK